MTLRTMLRRLEYTLLVLILMLACPIFSVGRDNVQDLIKKGNEAYARGRFNDAAETYQKILALGYVSPAAYFNLGNAFYKLGEMPSSILYYEKAYKLSPGDEDIKLNLQLANLKITDRIEKTPEFFLTKWWKAFTLSFSLETLSVLSVVFFLAGFALLIIYLFAAAVPIKKTTFYMGILILILGFASLFVGSAQNNYLNTTQEGIVFSSSVNVKSGPAQNLKTLFVIHEGTKVSVSGNDNNWIKIELPNGNSGWIEQNTIKKI